MHNEPFLYYVHDPMCSWCWGFRTTWSKVKQELPKTVIVKHLLGGLAPDSSEPMTLEMQQFLQQTWRKIEVQVPGTVFNHDFWKECQPRRSTYPACRAVISARLQEANFELPMIHAIQTAYYTRAQNPSDIQVLKGLATSIGLNGNQFTQDMHSENTQSILDNEIHQARQIGATHFPSLVLAHNQKKYQILIDYNNHGRILDQINTILV